MLGADLFGLCERRGILRAACAASAIKGMYRAAIRARLKVWLLEGGAVVGRGRLCQREFIAHRKCGLMCARCDVFWERSRKRRGASSVEQRETMCKMRRIVQNVGFRAVKIHLFDVKHA